MNADLMMGCGTSDSTAEPFESGVGESGDVMVDSAIVDSPIVELVMVELEIGSWADMIGFYPLYFYLACSPIHNRLQYLNQAQTT